MECDCPECADGNESSPPVPGYTATALINRIQKKRLDLMEQLIDHYGGRNHLNDNDLIRYSAMVEVLKAVLQ